MPCELATHGKSRQTLVPIRHSESAALLTTLEDLHLTWAESAQEPKEGWQA